MKEGEGLSAAVKNVACALLREKRPILEHLREYYVQASVRHTVHDDEHVVDAAVTARVDFIASQKVLKVRALTCRL